MSTMIHGHFSLFPNFRNEYKRRGKIIYCVKRLYHCGTYGNQLRCNSESIADRTMSHLIYAVRMLKCNSDNINNGLSRICENQMNVNVK